MILVTGAAGFIGSNLVATLNELGREDLVLCDWLGHDGRWENLAKRSFAHFLFPNQLFGWLAASTGQDIDLILHMGAISETTACDGDLVIERNYLFTKRLWTWSVETEATMVYASSAATYGDGSAGFCDDLDINALKRLRPLNLYGWSKHIFDVYALNSETKSPHKWYGLKFFNVFGPNEFHKKSMRSVVCKVAPDILLGRAVQLFQSHRSSFPDGGQCRDFVWVGDVCEAVLHFVTNAPPSGIYNVGSGQARTFADFIGAAFNAAGRETRIDYVPMPDELRKRYQYFTEADIRKLRASGYDRPFMRLEDSVARYVATYLAGEDKCR